MINKIYQEQQAGKLTSAEAQSRAVNYVRELRYDNGAGYFFLLILPKGSMLYY